MIQLVAILGVFGIGVVFSILGAVKLPLTEKLQIDDARFGTLISTLMFTSIILVLIIGPLVDAAGYQPVAVLGFLIAGVSIFLLAKTGSYRGAIIACIGLAIGGMAVNTIGNALLPQVLFDGQNPPAASNLGNVFFGVGAFITPFLVGLLLKRLGFSKSLSIVGVIILVPIIFALLAANYPALSASGYSLLKTIALLSNTIVLVAALALFCYIALEVSMGGWITTYLTGLGMTTGRASGVLSGFWITIMVARLIASGIVTPDIGSWVIAILAIASVITIGLMMMVKSATLAAVGVLLTGLAFGPIFPTVVGVTFSQITPELYGSVFAIIFAVGLLGGSTIPKAIGNYAKGNIQKGLVIALVTAGLLFVISFGL